MSAPLIEISTGSVGDALPTESAELRRLLDRAERLRIAASHLLAAVGMDLGFAELLDRIVEIVRDASDADGAFLHLWDSQREMLVLSAATEGIEKGFLHKVEMPLGQGLSGLAALRRQPVVVNLDPQQDPHFRHFPELGEERYRSTAKLPILRNGRDLIGVLSLNAGTPNRFDDSHLAIAKELAALVAGVISAASLGDAVARRAHVLGRLSELTATLCSSRPEFEILGAVANTAVAVLNADLCVLVLADRETGEPTLRAIAPFRSDVLDAVATLTSQRPKAAVEGAPTSSLLERYLNSELPAGVGTMASVPLIVGDVRLGFLSCYRPHRFTAEDHDLLSIIGRQIALALTDASSRWGGQEQSSRVVFDRLSRGDIDDHTASIATALGANLTRPHVLLRARAVVPPASGHEPPNVDVGRATTAAVSTIRGFNPGSLTYVSLDQIFGLVEVAGPDGDRRLQRRIRELADDLAQRCGIRLEVGLSRVVEIPTELPAALQEATEALEIGPRVAADPVAHYDDLAAQIHFYRVALDPSYDHDPMVARLSQLLEHDPRRGSELLHTLDVYLACRGNGSHAADELGIHRNTLRQRLERIATLTGLVLDATEDWLPLQLAVRVVTIRTGSPTS